MDNGYVERDDSRQIFQRQNGEVGIYLTVYDAQASDTKDIGLEHFFLMNTTELLFQQLNQTDLVNIRASFIRKQLFMDTYIERFEPGVVMAVGFDNTTALDTLWDLHRNRKLNAVMHDVLVTPSLLKAIGCTKITLETKLWDDEYDACRKELETRSDGIQSVKKRESDLNLVHRLRKYQKVLGVEVSSMRDLDNEMEQNRNYFITAMQTTLPEQHPRISSLREYEKYSKSEKGRKTYYRTALDLYSKIVQKWRAYFRMFQTDIVTPLLQIHRVCETKKQIEIKANIIKSVRDMQRLLQTDTDLQNVKHAEMARKVLRRDAPLFLGLLSLVPLGVDRVVDIDIMIDDYMRDYQLEVDNES